MSVNRGPITDEDLARQQAFREYVRPELEVMMRVALRLTRSRVDAEDLVQESVLRAYRSLDRFDGRHPRAWLLTILRNTHINRIRKKQPDLFHDEERALAGIPARGREGEDGAAAALDGIPDPTLIDALRDLSPKHRDVVTLVDIDDLSYQEAADILGVPIGTVMSRLHRARKRIRDHLLAAGYLDGETSR